MSRGRKPKPTKLKQLEGNNGKRKLNDDEPQFDLVEDFAAPSRLDEVAKGEWHRVAPQLIAQKMFSVVDRPLLEAYCVAYSRWCTAEDIVQAQILRAGAPRPATGPVLELPLAMEFHTSSGYAQQIPQVGTANTYLAIMVKLASEFGFTPAARARLHVEPAHKRNPHDEFFNHPEEGGRIPDAALQ